MPFTIDITHSWDDAALGWDAHVAASASTPFQNRAWLSALYPALLTGGARAVIVIARAARTGELALALPLMIRREGGKIVLTFADGGLSDYNAPLIGPAAPRDAQGMRVLWNAILAELPGIDLVRFQKMPRTVGGAPNPMALLARAYPCVENGNLVVTGDDWNAWRFTLEKTVRKELERSGRVFFRHEAAAFRRVLDPDEGLRILAAMETQQQERMRAKGAGYTLDTPAMAGIYRTLVRDALAGGFAVLTALCAGDEVVAGLLGIRDADRYIMIRIANAGGAWNNCSPGRLIIERSMADLHAEGYRAFDFSVGNYAYKRRFGVTALPLVDMIQARSWRGLPRDLRARAVAWIRARPGLEARLKRFAGKKD